MFKMETGRGSLDILEKYASYELDPADHSGFLAICRLFGVTEKDQWKTETELVEILQKFKRLCSQYGVNIPHDFTYLLERCKVREEIERQEKENDRIEIELSKSKDKIAEIYIKKIRLNELRKEKEALIQTVRQIESDREYSDVSREVLSLAKICGMKTAKNETGRVVRLKTDWNIEFHNYFMPFVNLSIETVNFIYEQISMPSYADTHEKEKSVTFLMKYYQKRTEAKIEYFRHRTPSNTLNYLITLILLEKTSIHIQDICTLIKKSRTEIIKNIFYLSCKKILIFNRDTDTVTLYPHTHIFCKSKE